MITHPAPSALLTTLGFLLAAAALPAQDARLEWLPADASVKFGYYMPQRLTLSATRPASLKKMPDGVTKPLFGEITFGPAESARKVIVLVDEPANGTQRLWVDCNANGDLTDDPPATWSGRKVTSKGRDSTTFNGTATLRMSYDGKEREQQLSLYRFDPATRADAKTMLLYYRQYGYTGEVTLGGKNFKAMLDDGRATGDFRGKEGDTKGSGVDLLLDLNGDGKFDSRSERFDVRKPFNVAGTTYEITGLTASGTGLQFIKSDKTVEETKPAATVIVGAKPPSFTAKTTTGQAVKFPDDYKDKVVLLDFWATWCGPCRAELPNLKAVYEEFHSQGFEVLGVSLDNEDSVKKLAQFTKDNGMPWPQIADGKFWDAELARFFGVHSIPHCIVYSGRTGMIVALTDKSRGSLLRTSVASALGQKVTTPAPSASAKSSATKSGRVAPAAGSGIAPEAEHPSVTDPLLAKAAAALKAGQLMSADTLVKQRQNPQAGSVKLPAPATTKLDGRDIARLARESYLRVGWYYLCTRCDHWHTKLAGGYAVAPDALATAWHVMTPPDTMKEGYALVADGAGNVVPVTGVVAADQRMDAIVLRATGAKMKPLALSAAEVGDAAFCFSDPLKQRNYFSAGIVNRFHLLNDNGTQSADAGDTANLRVNVSTDWGPGSSGAAVLDIFGNVIGHVATITSLKGGTNNTAWMTIHDAIPAQSVRTLLQPAASAAP
ncbi:MAG: redoxin domain-containing protein [Verrucomicrobia bacterium]|nr:redoxin domain-containing protein [Verrucomicrobiota bacterium]